MINPGFSMASPDPEDHPELTFSTSSPAMHLPPGCPPPDPEQIVTPSVVVSPHDDDPTPSPDGGMVTVAHEDLPEPVFVDPEGS